jgi:DNA-binding CsgD family transcriptional regulator
MQPYLELWKRSGREVQVLEHEPITVGRGRNNVIVLADDPAVSRLHAIFQEVVAGWSVRDLGSRNGSYVNGERILGERVLRPNDEVRIGSVRFFFRAYDVAGNATTTSAVERPPVLTRREREVLVTLCRPVASGDMFTEPASVRQMAAELVVTEAAVKQHLLNLYEKFGIEEDGDRRRVRLANEAIRRGAVVLAELLRDAVELDVPA